MEGEAPVALLIVWQTMAELEWISALLFPAPLTILESFADLAKSAYTSRTCGSA